MKVSPFLLFLAVSSPGLALSASADAGKTLFQTQCVACHGANAEGNAAMGAPALAGQPADYLFRQLQHFRSGQRGAQAGDSAGAMMIPMARSLPDEAAAQGVADYLSTLPKPAVAASVQGDVVQGGKLYQAKCAACHGGKGEGNPAFSSPRLTQVGDQYLLLQVQHYRQGLRGYDGQDRYGKQMKMMAATVSDAELQDILAYLGQTAAQ
ncbi:MAG TPA: c-type cytochrome [Pseudomonas sp.]|nr:c-type cytochrome [Pseudomonas sp.]